MYAYWYEEGQLMSYVGTKADFKTYMDRYSYYVYGAHKTMPNDWYKTEVISGRNHIYYIFAEDVPSDIRAMHLLLVKE